MLVHMDNDQRGTRVGQLNEPTDNFGFSLTLWLLSWAALLAGAEWLEASAAPTLGVDTFGPALVQSDSPSSAAEETEAPGQAWSGVVRLPNGQPAANVALSAWPQPQPQGELPEHLREFVFQPVYATTDAQGRFAFEPPLDVPHEVEPQLLDLGDLRDASGEAPSWSGEGQASWIYEPFPEYWFRVSDNAGAPLLRFTFDTVHGDQRRHSVASQSWTFSRPAAERSQPQSDFGRPGWHRLCVRAPGCVPRSVPVPGSSPEEPHEVRLQPAGALDGRLLDGAGKPLAGRRLLLRIAPDDRGWHLPRAHPCAPGGVDEHNRALYGEAFEWLTDAGGQFEWNQLDPTLEYELQLAGPRRISLARIPRTAAGQLTQLGDLRLPLPPGVPPGPL